MEYYLIFLLNYSEWWFVFGITIPTRSTAIQLTRELTERFILYIIPRSVFHARITAMSRSTLTPLLCRPVLSNKS